MLSKAAECPASALSGHNSGFRPHEVPANQTLPVCLQDLRHPNIVTCLGFECKKDSFYIYLEYAAGRKTCFFPKRGQKQVINGGHEVRFFWGPPLTLRLKNVRRFLVRFQQNNLKGAQAGDAFQTTRNWVPTTHCSTYWRCWQFSGLACALLWSSSQDFLHVQIPDIIIYYIYIYVLHELVSQLPDLPAKVPGGSMSTLLKEFGPLAPWLLAFSIDFKWF